MSPVERSLREYWFARRSIGRLLMDYSTAKAALEHSETKNPLSGYEYAAQELIEQRRVEVKAIEQRLSDERATISRLESALKEAELTERECEYVRIRYFENRNAEAACQRMYCSPATGGRIREAVIIKLRSVLIKGE